MPIGSVWDRFRPNNDEPQSPQNHFSPPPSGFHTRSLSSPATIRNVSGAGWAFADAAAPRCSAATLAALAAAIARDHERPGHPEPNGPAVAAAGEREVGHRQRYLLISGRDPKQLRGPSVISLDDSPTGTTTTTPNQMPGECRYPDWQQSRRPDADAGTASFCSIAALCSALCSPATSEALRRGHGDAGRLGVTPVLSICVQVARVSGALRDRRASSSAGMTSAARSRIERNTWA